MSSKHRAVILCAGILTALLTVFNNCGGAAQIEPNDTSSLSSSTAPIATASSTTFAPNLTASNYVVQTGLPIQLTVVGGAAPFVFTVTPSNGGAVDAVTKVFKGNQPGVSTIQVADSQGRSASIAVTVTAVTVTPTPAKASSCTGPDLRVIASGASALYYFSSTADPNGSPSTCVSQTRTCTNGVLSGSYVYFTCVLRQSGNNR